MSYIAVTADEVASDPGLTDWRVVRELLRAEFAAGSFPAAAALTSAIAEAAEAAGHHPDVTVRYPDRVVVTLTTHATGGLTTRDTDLAGTISGLATEAGAEVRRGTVLPTLELGIDTTDADRLRPFWAAALGYEANDDGELAPPGRDGPRVWFQPTSEHRPGRNRIHLDVYVSAAEATGRVEAALAAGGRLATDRFAPDWWVLADADGNEVCICV